MAGTFTPHPGIPIIPLGPMVRILVLTDGYGCYRPERDFGLTELVEVLRSTNLLFARFEVTTAHRSAQNSYGEPSGADISSFRFDNASHFSPDRFDAVWFFGVWSPSDDPAHASPPFSPAEQRIVAQFMDGGGGVFATGDHEDLGQALCGWIPRVRTMRQWHFPPVTEGPTVPNDPGGEFVGFYSNYQESEANSPPKFGRYRHDTLVQGHGGTGYQFENQSDDVPAAIQPTMFGGGTRFLQVTYPHPLLCTSGGVINVLPDHMHEGECRVPSEAELPQQFSFDGYARAEYPTDQQGRRPQPVVVARGVIIAGHTTGVPASQSYYDAALDPPVAQDHFPCIVAYDGHAAHCGRVVTDSTFHHFFNINLTGAGATVPVSEAGNTYKGLKDSASWPAITAYYRNVAYWLAPAKLQEAMYAHVLWAARADSQLRMQALRPASGTMRFDDLVSFGTIVRRVLARLAPPCATLAWSSAVIAAVDPLSVILSNYWYQLIHLPDPPPDTGALSPLQGENLISAYHGAVMNRLLSAGARFDGLPPDRLAPSVLSEARTGVSDTVAAVRAVVGQHVPVLQALLGRLQEAVTTRA